jgi:hypothetical protein
MVKEFFVMLSTQSGGATPMIDGGEMAFFATQAEADAASRNNPLGDNFGYEVFELGCGC